MTSYEKQFVLQNLYQIGNATKIIENGVYELLNFVEIDEELILHLRTINTINEKMQTKLMEKIDATNEHQTTETV